MNQNLPHFSTLNGRRHMQYSSIVAALYINADILRGACKTREDYAGLYTAKIARKLPGLLALALYSFAI